MATTTTNFGWDIPQSTDLVKDGATAIAALGQDIDTALVDLKGGTTGQVLAKASGTDLDYSWVTTDDLNAIQNSIVDAKGDLISATANDTPARLAVGNNGETLVADSSATTGLRYQGNYAAGKNKIINGDFGVWQRGTTIAVTNNTQTFGADRYRTYISFSAGTASISQQTFTLGTAPVAGYEGSYFSRVTCGSTSTYTETSQKIEDVRAFAGQTVTFSFWAKASAAIVMTPSLVQQFGSGGSGDVGTSGSNITLTTSWVRYTVPLTIPSIAGKTIGTGSSLTAVLIYASGSLNSATIDLWGWQVEAGSVATAFQTATGTIQGELAACQRYAYSHVNGNGQMVGNVFAFNSTQLEGVVQFPVTMRIAPTLTASSGTNYFATRSGGFTSPTVTIFNASTTSALLYCAVTGATAGSANALNSNASQASILFVSEL
jgi:hypothetical protein